MIKVQFKLPPNYSQTDFDRQMSLALRVAPDEVTEYKIIKKSLDCRDKSKIHYLMTVGVGLARRKINTFREIKSPAVFASDKFFG